MWVPSFKCQVSGEIKVVEQNQFQVQERCGHDDGDQERKPFSIPIVQRWKASPLIAADCGGFEDQEDCVDEDAHNGSEHDGRDAVGE